MTITEKSPRPAFSRSRTQRPSKEWNQDQGTPGVPADNLFSAMIEMRDLHRIARAWVGALLRATPDSAREALHELLPGDITDERLTIAARAVWYALEDGDPTDPRTVAHAAYRHRLVREHDHAVFYAFLVDLSQCTPPRRELLDAATTPAHMGRALVAQEVTP